MPTSSNVTHVHAAARGPNTTTGHPPKHHRELAHAAFLSGAALLVPLLGPTAYLHAKAELRTRPHVVLHAARLCALVASAIAASTTVLLIMLVWFA